MASYKPDHIHLTTPDPGRAARFYIETMGARVTREFTYQDKPIIDLDLGGIPLRISSSTGADDKSKGLQTGLQHLALFVDNMDRAVSEIGSSGADFVVKPHSPQPGVKAAFIRTPDGILIEITEKK